MLVIKLFRLSAMLFVAVVMMMTSAWAADELYLAAKKEGEVNWYGAWPKSLMDDLAKAFEAKYPGIKASIFRSGSSKIAAKIEAEQQGGKILVDVIALTEESIVAAFKNRGFLERYKPVGFEKFRKEYRDDDGSWITPRVATVGIWYNVERLNRLKLPAPTSWHDLANPVYRSEVVMASPLYSGTISSLVGAFSQKPGFGWEYFGRMAANDALFVADLPDVARAVAAGQRGLGAVILGYISIHPPHPKGTIALVKPKEGLLVIQATSSVAKNRPHNSAGKLLQTFLASADAAHIIRDAKYSSGRIDIPGPEGIPDPTPAIFPNAKWIEDHSEEIRSKWAEMTGRK